MFVKHNISSFLSLADNKQALSKQIVGLIFFGFGVFTELQI